MAERAQLTLISRQANAIPKPSRAIIGSLIRRLETEKLKLSDLTAGQMKLLKSFYDGCYGSREVRGETLFLRNRIAEILKFAKQGNYLNPNRETLSNERESNIIEFRPTKHEAK